MSKRRQPIDPEQWLTHLAQLRDAKDTETIKSSISAYHAQSPSLLEKGLGIADILLALGLDNDTLAAAIIYPAVQANLITIDSLMDLFGDGASKLLQDILQMQSLGTLQHISQRNQQQTENVRKMLLAMVTDVRSVLIVLAERLWQLRTAKNLAQEQQQKLAHETLEVYAPLANRLGVWQLKWEIEDLCLRYLQPDIYMQLAKSLASRRDEREAYVQSIITLLTNVLTENDLRQFQVTGRVKHIYSIYKKMQRKNANVEQIYDMTAVRVLVQTVEDCYNVLGVLQNHWAQIPEEFDDYINHPKPNGYRSIHTVIVGPEDRYVEVQIRTLQMHHESELGVAAHWRYKEGVLQTSSYEAKIALLRQIMAWQKEVVHTDDAPAEKATQDLFADQVYVFTPTGDILDLPKGATPLDFAYTIHSEVGHRCRGAKVDGKIVPLTYQLQTGERVEILTAKEANPSRDWVNPHLGFIKSARARAKVQHWFRVRNSIQNAIDGRELLEKEARRLGISDKVDLNAIAAKFHYKTSDALLAALASGEIRIAQIINFINPPESIAPIVTTDIKVSGHETTSNVQIFGINNLLTNVARCCKPLPGDSIIGYVTRTRGVTVHRRDCSNIVNVKNDNMKRIIEVNWGGKQTNTYAAELLLRLIDRTGLLRDITTLLASEKINVLGLQTQKTNESGAIDIHLTLQIVDRDQLTHAINLLQQVPNVISVNRM